MLRALVYDTSIGGVMLRQVVLPLVVCIWSPCLLAYCT